jgi:hypothetical protein
MTMSNFINKGKTYKQYWKTQYCFRPMSSRRVNSVKELNRLTERIAKLEDGLWVISTEANGCGRLDLIADKCNMLLGDEDAR